MDRYHVIAGFDETGVDEGLSFIDDIFDILRQDGFPDPSSLLLKSFDGQRLRRVLKTGTDRDTHSKRWWKDGSDGISPENVLYAVSGMEIKLWWGEGNHLAVYHPNDLRLLSSESGSYYKPENVMPVAVFEVAIN